MPSLSPSRLAVMAAKREPIHTLSVAHDTHCAMCATSLPSGAPATDFEVGVNFNDQAALGAPRSAHLCGDCAVLRDKPFMQKYSKTVITREGFFAFASNNDRAYWLTNPPPPPFLMIGTEAIQQHLIWRGPVSLSRNMFFVRFGHDVLTIRRHLLQKGLQAARTLGRLLENTTGQKNRTNPHPFVALDRALASPLHGLLRPEIRSVRTTSRQAHEACALIEQLGSGEIWGLSALLFAREPYQQPAKVL